MNGDGLSGYDIFQFKKKVEGSYEYELVGEWTDGCEDKNLHKLYPFITTILAFELSIVFIM